MAPTTAADMLRRNGSIRGEVLGDAYGPNYDRLVQVKTTWDPENLFRMNMNIEPAA